MSTAVATKLEAARVRLEELARLTAELASTHPTVFEDPDLRERLIDFEGAHGRG